MITVNQAVASILRRTASLKGEEIPLIEGGGRVLFEDVRSRRRVPPFANSAMDGYAVRWQDVKGASATNPVVLRVVDEVRAGYIAKRSVQQGTAIRIMTGAVVPRGADTIIRVEYTECSGKEVCISKRDHQGSHVRKAGEDVQLGRRILQKGKRIGPADIGLMASVGKSKVQVYRRPTVALISTGDELLEVEDPPRPGKIVNSNSYTLYAGVQQAGAVPISLGIVRDKRKSLAAAFKKALRYDVIMTSGGVSVGDYDFVKEALGDVGVKMQFWKVAQKPGHPMAFGRIGQKPVFGLPGNPVSSFVSFLLYARPVLRKMMGHKDLFLPVIQATLEHEISTSHGVKEFIRCRLRRHNENNFVSTTGSQSSGVLSSLSLAQGLIVANESDTRLPKGRRVPVILLDDQGQNKGEMGF
ncbi:MAG: molybdopterin molybdenumtransferase MoeA [Deltaproteobacteria bacterium]|nr:molybdopterin molybdenumtransferase MoeA [Deltaproteobacteria bacterium]